MKTEHAAFARAIFITLVASATLVACGGKTVQRIDSNTVTDLSGRWNDTDSRLVSEQMVASMLNARWIDRFAAANSGQRPAIIVGDIRNNSSEHIPTETFTKDIERAFINTGAVRVVASSTEREGLRDEREDQQDFSSPETVKRYGREVGADYMLMGGINTITDQEGGDKVTFYQIDLELIDIETNEKVFLDQKEIKKFIGRGKYKG